MHADVDDLAAAGGLALDQRQHQRHQGEARHRLIALIAARADRRDGVIVVAAAVERAAEGQADQVRAVPVGPRTGEPERRERHDDQPVGRGGEPVGREVAPASASRRGERR